jgi:hypothetical protein
VFDFTGFIFPDSIDFFKGRDFSKDTYFVDAKFYGETTNFFNAEFNGKMTDFGGASFSGERTNLRFTIFSGKETIFQGAKFRNMVFGYVGNFGVIAGCLRVSSDGFISLIREIYFNQKKI